MAGVVHTLAKRGGRLWKARRACRQFGSTLLLQTRLISGASRMLPELVILGAQKAGTTSLFNYLSQHPRVRPPIKKEVHYFDLNYAKGLEWYQAHFPTLAGEQRRPSQHE